MQPEWKADLINAMYPIVRLEIYPKGAFKVIREPIAKLQRRIEMRGEIGKLTKKSLRKLMFIMQATEVRFTSMLTLTYPANFPNDGEEVKGDLRAMLQRIRRKDFLYLWFLEFQKRGAPHIHILLDNEGISPYLRVDFGLAWTRIVAKSDRYKKAVPVEQYDAEVLKMCKFNLHHSCWEILRDAESARNYVMKYASKQDQKDVPKRYYSVGRFWGCSQKVKSEPLHEVEASEEEIREYLALKSHPAAEYPVIPKLLWSFENGQGNLTCDGIQL